jgi:hypothetical protein
MSAIEILLGDFRLGIARVRTTPSGRRAVTLTNARGAPEEISLTDQLAGCADHDEGRVSDYLERWMAREGRSLSAALDQSFRHERLFVVVLTDGRKFVARAHIELVAELRALARGRIAAAAAQAEAVEARVGHRGGLLGRLRPAK